MIKDSLSLFEFLHQNKLFPALKIFFNHIFVLSIASFLFETIYFEYTLLNISDYKGIYNFFIKGDFAIPFVLFFMTWLLTFLLSAGIFTAINMRITKRINKKIHSRKFLTQEQIDKIDWGAEVTKGVKLSEKIGDKWFVVLYNRIKESMTLQQKREIYNGFQKMQRSSADDFIMIFRGMIAIFIFFCTQEHFGWILFSFVLICFMLYSAILIFIYQIAEILPSIVNKIDKEMLELSQAQDKK